MFKNAMPVFCFVLAGAIAAPFPAVAGNEKLVYSFTGGADGFDPGPLIDVGGTFYGVTSFAGVGTCAGGGCGTVFSVTPGGAERVLYSFQGSPDGANPAGALVHFKGKFYGVTSGGGECFNGCGTVFSVSTTGVEKVVYTFQGFDDGFDPRAGLTALGGLLYGTTCQGGAGGSNGTIFSVTPTGTHTVIYSFQGGADGSCASNLINVKGTLYGSTSYGGVANGTVFSVTPAGVKTTLYEFQGGADGSDPSALTSFGGKLYGTTINGGTSEDGTVFDVSLRGAHKVIYSFKGYADGFNPMGSLLPVGDFLYGTTYNGGTGGLGTVFAVSPSGIETVLHTFLGGNDDGAHPGGGLIGVKHALYGTTSGGGTGIEGGTVFRLEP